MTIVEKSLELIFAEEFIKGLDFYDLCSSHRAHDRSLESNKFPCKRLDPRELAFWKRDNPETDDHNLENRVIEQFYEDLDSYAEFDWLKDFQIFPDMNGYRLLIDTPIYSLWLRREEQEEIILCEQKEPIENYDAETVQACIEEINEIDKELIECYKAYAKFCEICEGLKEYYDHYVWVVTKEGKYDFVDEEWFEECKDEYGWSLWKKEEEVKT